MLFFLKTVFFSRKIFIASIFLLIVFGYSPSFSQSVISGWVVDDNNQSILSASVYLASTSMGASTDYNGYFHFKVSQQGKYELIVSYVGYNKIRIPVLIGTDSVFSFKLQMQQENAQLGGVLILPDTTNRKRDFKEFKRIFLGETRNASLCEIKNPKDIFVYYDEAERTLVAYCKKPVIIENRALGYNLFYEIEHFKAIKSGFDVNVDFSGSTRFGEMADSISKFNHEKLRERSYQGSLMHLMKSLRSNRLKEEEWEVRIEYPEIRPDDFTINDKIRLHRKRHDWDSVNYYKEMKLLPIKSHLRSEPLHGNELLDKNDHELLVFNGKLLVIYMKERDERFQPPKGKYYPYQLSTILIEGGNRRIFENGYYEPQKDLYVSGYLAFSERVSEFLPYEYAPAKKKP
ncbi:MAG: carboxypeptidase-like regulatory domain-containing protein [Cyclobacteriaceae bacterium]|nr:carboxypeptidase-like regulatory domain-containing protein [Cyclobacteriaceae bacterium]